MTTYIDQEKGRGHGMRPFLCRQGFHRWGPNTLWPGSTRAQVRWQRHCTRCGALLAFSAEPFLYGLIDRWKARRAATKTENEGEA